MRTICAALAACFSLSTVTKAGFASVKTYTNQAEWQAVAGPFTTITFTELPANAWINEQYADLGVHFTDGSDQIYFNQNIFSDNFGLNGAFDETTLEFDTPMTSVAVEFPGNVKFKLYSNGELLFTSFTFGDTFSDFAGLISTQAFDEVLLYDPFGGMFADTLYFGPPIPAPGALLLLGVAGLLNRSRRRIL